MALHALVKIPHFTALATSRSPTPNRTLLTRCAARTFEAANLKPVAEDGELGTETTLAANSFLDYPALLAALRSEAAGYFRLTAARQAKTKTFLEGWLNRAYS